MPSSASKLTAALACALAACVDCLPERHEFRGLRVVGVVQSPLPGRTGAPVTLRAVTTGSASIAWYRCPSEPVAAPALSTFASVDELRCVAAGEVARGESITVVATAQAPALVVEDVLYGRWTPWVGVACAGSLTPPVAPSPWPGCTDGPIVPFLARVRTFDALGDPAPAAPLRIDAVELARDNAFVPADGATVPTCTAGRAACAPVQLRVRHSPPGSVADASSYDGSDPAAWLRPRVGYLVSASAPADADDRCLVDDPRGVVDADATFGWVPPPTPQDVAVVVSIRDVFGRFAWARVTVRVR